MRFSERHGFRAVRDSLQIESMDEALRNGLWNVLEIHVWEHGHDLSEYALSTNDYLFALCRRIWVNFYKDTLSTLDSYWPRVYRRIQGEFFGYQ